MWSASLPALLYLVYSCACHCVPGGYKELDRRILRWRFPFTEVLFVCTALTLNSVFAEYAIVAWSSAIFVLFFQEEPELNNLKVFFPFVS